MLSTQRVIQTSSRSNVIIKCHITWFHILYLFNGLLPRSGDGKLMQSTNFQESKRCWICDQDVADYTLLQPSDHMPSHVRAGAFLGVIPPARRVGDYVHCACRVANAILKRIGSLAQAKSRRLHAAFKDFVQQVAWDATQEDVRMPSTET